ncbi:MAG: TonB-dependent receptor [Candidatus Eisenbacteria bacterium]
MFSPRRLSRHGCFRSVAVSRPLSAEPGPSSARLLDGGSLALLFGLLLLGLILLPSIGTAAELTGRVMDPDGHPVAGAEVTRPETGSWTMTDVSGAFVLPDVPKGESTLVIRRAGFEPRVLHLGGPGPARDRLFVVLAESPFELDEVDVTASRSVMEPGRSPLPISHLQGDRLDAEYSVSLAHAVQQQAGLRTLSTGGEIGKPVVRGLRLARAGAGRRQSRRGLLLQRRGRSVGGRGQAERIEIIRGPASVLYGSDALGGVVSVVPRSVWDVEPGEVQTHIESYFASNNKEFGAIGRVEGVRGNLGWHVLGIGRKSEALHTPDGELENTGFFAANGEAALGLRGDRGNFAMRVVHYGGEFKLLEAGGPPPGVPEGEEKGPERKLSDERVQLSGDYLLSKLRLEGRLQFQRHSLIELSDDFETMTDGGRAAGEFASLGGGESGNASREEKKEMEAFNLLLNTVTAEALVHHAREEKGHGTLGVWGEFQKNDSRGPIPLVPDATVASAAAFAFETLRFGLWDVAGGARIDVRSLDADPNEELGYDESMKRDYTALSGDVGLVFHPVTDLSLAANVGRGFRAPNLFELLANGPHLGEARYEVGNPALDPEADLNLDGGIRFRNQRFQAELNGYRNQIRDYIYITPTDRMVGDLRVYEHRQDDAVLTGFEVSGTAQVSEMLSLRATHDQVRGTRDFDDEPLPLIPPPRTTGEVELRMDRLSWAQSARFGVEGEFHEKQTRRSEFDLETGAYSLWNVDAAVDKMLGGRSFRFGVDVRNLLDRSYRSYLSRYKEFALDPGRNVIVRVSTSL